MYATGKHIVFVGAPSARSQELYDHNQHTLHNVPDNVNFCQKRGDHVRLFNSDGIEHGILWRSVCLLHRRGVRTEVKRRPDVGDKRVLLRWLIADLIN